MRAALLSAALAALAASAETGPAPELWKRGLYLEAESFSGPWRLQTNYPGYSGSGFRVSNASGVAASELRLRLSVVEGGDYTVWARGLASPGGKREFSVEVGGVRLPPTHGDAPKTGFRWERCGSAKLEPGPVAITIRDAGEGYECPDAVFLSGDPKASPPDPAARLELAGEASAEAVRRANLERYPALLAKSRRGLPSTAEAWRSRAAELARGLPRLLGLEPEPPRSPLRARAAGVLEREGYRIEKLVFESRPGFPVAANLYLPSGPSAPPPPFPAVLCPVGHWGLSKAEPVVQSRAASFARLGLAALAYDPLGQGERAVPGNEHSVAHLAALLGESNMTYMVWDSVRALDCLETRAEIDRERIGCTGCSGGGLNSLYLSAFEAVRARADGAARRPRVRASAPVGYIATFSSFLATGIAHCPCSHVPGIGAAADMDEVLALFAPEALLVIGGKRDPMFTEAGMREAFRGVAALYEFAGAARPPELFFDDCGHDYSKPMRERAYGFFLRELLGRGDGSPVTEPLGGWTPEPPEALFVFPVGRVPPDAATYRSLVSDGLAAERGKDARAAVEALARALPEPTGASREIAVPAPESLARSDIEVRIDVDSEGFRTRILRAPGSSRLRILLLEDAGLTEGTPSALAAIRERTGATAVALEPPLWREEGRDRHLALTNGLLVGRHPAALAARALLAEAGRAKDTPTALLARGPAASAVALVAFLLAPDVRALAATGAPESWFDLADPGTAREEGLLPRAGLAGDIADLLRAASPRPVLWGRAPGALEEAAAWLAERARE